VSEFWDAVSYALIWFIALWGLGWLIAMPLLARTARGIAGRLRDRLHNLVRTFSEQPDRDTDRHITDEIETLLAVVRETVSDPTREFDRGRLTQWMADKDADKTDLKRYRFEWWYNFARTQIEVLPLAGICGTLLRMAVALATTPTGETGAASDDFMLRLTLHFSHSLVSTLAALVGTVLLMCANAAVEPGFARLIELRAEFRRVVDHARRELARG